MFNDTLYETIDPTTSFETMPEFIRTNYRHLSTQRYKGQVIRLYELDGCFAFIWGNDSISGWDMASENEASDYACESIDNYF